MRTIEQIDAEILALNVERQALIDSEEAAQLAALRLIVPDVEWSELDIDGFYVNELPYPISFGMEDVLIVNIRRDSAGYIEFQIAQLDGTLFADNNWYSAFFFEADI